MALVERVLPAEPVVDLDDYIERFSGGRALELASRVGAEAVIGEIEASGLRGRGGAGFPTGRKWRTLSSAGSDPFPPTVVINAAEGEPGTFKDRAILRANPFHVLEGALVAARVLRADRIVVGLKASFGRELARIRSAVDEMVAAGWIVEGAIEIVEGPDEYLFGEETALLEVVAGRPPLPRIAPPYRRGAEEEPPDGDQTTPDVAPPTLVDNVETLANVPGILTKGSEWFRSVGTAESPGTIVCTISGRVERPGVGEIAMGTPLATAIDEIAGGVVGGGPVTAVLPGAANAFIPPENAYVPLTYEAMAAVGSGLGSAGYIVLDRTDDVIAAAAGVSRFLAVESCGQCTPCKQDGLAMADLLARLSRSQADRHDLEELIARAGTVGDGARCNLALQQQALMAGISSHWSGTLAARADVVQHVEAREPMLIAEILDIDSEGTVVDLRQADKQPDWTYDEVDSGMAPADRL